MIIYKSSRQLHKFFISCSIVIILSVFFLLSVANAASVFVHSGSLRFNSKVKSLKEIRDQGVIKQKYDFSCGAAALATLFTFGFGKEVSEINILEEVLASLPKNKTALMKKQGLSLLDLQKVARAYNYKAQGFKISPESLLKLRRPVIVYIKPFGYDHFAVLKTVRNNQVYLADPSLGNVRMPIYKFTSIWLNDNGKGIIFAVESEDNQWASNYLKGLPEDGDQKPEVLNVHEMLTIGNYHAAIYSVFRK